jgi:3-hydroxyethyl bacteriochlorophyllide a dehydrogenase
LLNTIAAVLREPEKLVLSPVDLPSPEAGDVVVDIDWSGISTGTERLLWSGRMPDFPGMGYPLVPGYESVGRIVVAGLESGRQVGTSVFVPGARCFGEIRGLFGGAASRVVVPGSRTVPIVSDLGERGALLALAATAYHAIMTPGATPPDLIIGHGVLGRLMARLAVVSGGSSPVVWEHNLARRDGALGYNVVDPTEDDRRDYRSIYDVSGDATLLDSLIARLAPGGEVVLAGFYCDPINFAFPPAFMREARLRIAAEWKEPDLLAATELVTSGRLSLEGLITHRRDAADAPTAYQTAFADPACLKMILDWRALT